jgi:hypothetical protein
MKQRQMNSHAMTRVTTYMMEEHLVKPTKTQNMIHAFMVKLMRDMRTLSHNLAFHEAVLVTLLYRRFISIVG